MSADCPRCCELQQIAINASKAYHEALEVLEAAHIRNNTEMLIALSTRLKCALGSRDAAITELTNHESTCVGKKPAAALLSRNAKKAS
jgi:hypothetical protein